MRLLPTLALALSVVVYGCSTPVATTGPAPGAPVAPGAAANPQASAAPAPGAPAAAQPTTEQPLYAVWVMKGRASVDGKTPLANAELRAGVLWRV